ncbi:sensor histidine kinase [Streptomyces sp. HB132]|uniref:sensor histidine kinase n=1 Tax=Streptomyces sp. HB132 TaxID=767388 RepID=UPI0019620D2E|nr:histidine kinase [Streptomyces sp. HB132]MBM7443130.1 signal transduction histidine kinase [Streptomyces sp. HB132]
MIATPHPPLLKRVPPGVWVAAFWSTLILVRTLQRPDELQRLLRYHGNIEDAPLLVTAVVTTLGALLLFRAPLAAVAIALAGAVFSLGMEVRATPVVLFLLADAAVGYTAATCSRRVSVLAAVLPVGVLAAYTVWRLGSGYAFNLSVPAALASTVVIAWLIGNTIHQNRAHADTVRAQATQQAVTAERLRIARELHDMVAHNIGIIAIQAGVGSLVMDTQPAETRKALDAIEATSRETLAGLRRMLGALRRSDQESAPLDPLPGLAALGELVGKTAAAGVRVDVRWRGERRDLPSDVDLAAFRIVQEAVTNVVRHSGTRDCSVTVDYRPDELAIDIVDLGSGGTVAESGYGIAGMRERVSLLHGEFSAGPRPEGGFRVAARLPVSVEAGR